MTESYIGWALVVGIALGAAVVWFLLGRLPRRSDDVGPEERAEEARWISGVVESRGGIAPVALVDEVLELHVSYLDGPPLDVRPAPHPAPLVAASPPPLMPAGPMPQVEPVSDDSELADEDRRVV
ncbi:hypothetical protein BH23CHL6_BH23CHL6_06080 [soil metagenome]